MKTKKQKADKILERLENSEAGKLTANDASALILSEISTQLQEIITRLDKVKEQSKPSETPEMTTKNEDKETKKWYEKIL